MRAGVRVRARARARVKVRVRVRAQAVDLEVLQAARDGGDFVLDGARAILCP